MMTQETIKLASDQKRPEATHRQRVNLGASTLPIDPDGQMMGIIQAGASDLIPTVQFGNVLLSCTVTRAVPDDGIDDDALADQGRRVSKIAQTIVGSERRILQWAIDPSLKVTNPSGAPVPDVPSAAPLPSDKVTVEVLVDPAAQPPTPVPGAGAVGPAPDLPTPPSAE